MTTSINNATSYANYFAYDATSPSHLIHLTGRHKGLPVVTSCQGKYQSVRIPNDPTSRNHRLHRVVFEVFHGRSIKPGYYVDHIDGNPSNNAPENLREASPAENRWNSKTQANKADGLPKGLYRLKDDSLVVSITVKGRRYWRSVPSVRAGEHVLASWRKALHGEFANDGTHSGALS